MTKIPGNSSYIENWLLEYSSPKHRMSAPPPVQQLTSADVANVKEGPDNSEYVEILKRANNDVPSMSVSPFCKRIDVVFNYTQKKHTADGRYQEFPPARTFELAIGECRITTRRELGFGSRDSAAQVYGPMKSYARVGIPEAVVEAVKVHVRRATGLSDADYAGVKEVSNGLRWMCVEFAREGVHSMRVSQDEQPFPSKQRYLPTTSKLEDLETGRCKEPCVLFLQ